MTIFISISIGVFVQMFLAGIWHAGVVGSPGAHAIFGITLLLASLPAADRGGHCAPAPPGHFAHSAALWVDLAAADPFGPRTC